MKKMSIFLAIVLMVGVVSSFSNEVFAAEEDYAWVLVERYVFPLPVISESHYTHKLTLNGNTIEAQITTPYGLGAYGSADYNNPADMHAKYTWSEPPQVIKPKQASDN
jgi:hypothetical protein